MRILLSLIVLLLTSVSSMAVNVSVRAVGQPAESVFKELMRQTGKNFVYSSGLLSGVKVTVEANDRPLERVLDEMFRGTDITYNIKGNNVVLRRRTRQAMIVVSGYVREEGTGESLIGALVVDSSSKKTVATNSAGFYSIYVTPGQVTLAVSYPGFDAESRTMTIRSDSRVDFTLKERGSGSARQLSEVVVVADPNKSIAMESTDVGRLNLTRADITSTPTLFGEADVIKTLQLQPGVSAGVEAMAGMYVHGGANDENLYMLDNIPLYQVNHFGGLFSAFNTEAIKNVDFYKSTFPAKYDGRLSSIMAVNTKDGSMEGHHGSFKLGLTSGALNIDGPIIKGKTTYALAVRRSWFEVLTVPGLAIYNAVRQEKESTTVARYSFTDVNAKVTHHFSDNSQLHAMFYFGEDFLKGGDKRNVEDAENDETMRESGISKLRWGNLVASLGWNYAFSSKLFGEFTGAYTHYRSSLNREDEDYLESAGSVIEDSRRDYTTRNSIRDWTFRADMIWRPASSHHVTFGANYTFHTYKPQDNSGILYNAGVIVSQAVESQQVHASEIGAYIGDDWELSQSVRVNAGVHVGLFSLSGKSHWNIDPRLALRWRVNDHWSVKGAYARMSQYVHQLTESAISLPTDQWVPVAGEMRPQKSDKISVAGYYSFGHGNEFTASVEAYYKWMDHVIDYRDDYFLMPNDTPWQDKLCAGSGRAKGLDFMVRRNAGKITGHVAYSLLWADRQFDAKNDGRRFPARFDNRHKINVLLNWRINEKWEVNAAWTGMSGNRFSLFAQDYEILDTPDLPVVGDPSFDGLIDMNGGINNYRLPFYHRLDIGANRYTKHGMWNFSLYNAYCNMNVISVKKNRGYYYDSFQKFRLIPILPSVSYTWFF
ncbi:MAG: TonB-dependent receptor [Pseudoflavonifractor sp.]|nr:TonB-dependent receptor [Pseudoflavonifractor sp.]